MKAEKTIADSKTIFCGNLNFTLSEKNPNPTLLFTGDGLSPVRRGRSVMRNHIPLRKRRSPNLLNTRRHCSFCHDEPASKRKLFDNSIFFHLFPEHLTRVLSHLPAAVVCHACISRAKRNNKKKIYLEGKSVIPTGGGAAGHATSRVALALCFLTRPGLSSCRFSLPAGARDPALSRVWIRRGVSKPHEL